MIQFNLTLLTLFSFVSLNSIRTFSLCFWVNFPSNLKNPIPLLLNGFSNRSKNEVHWLKTILFSSEYFWLCSKKSKSLETFEDSVKLFSMSTLNGLSDGSTIRSFFLSIWRQIGHLPPIEVPQQLNRHSLQNWCAHGVKTGSSGDSMHIAHSTVSPFWICPKTSSMYPRDWIEFEAEAEFCRKLLASLFSSAFCGASLSQHISDDSVWDSRNFLASLLKSAYLAVSLPLQTLQN